MNDMALMHMIADVPDERRLLGTAQAHGVKVRYIVGLSTPKSTAAAWQENPTCVHCNRAVESASTAALVITRDKTRRVAHRGACLVLACIATNPAIVADRSDNAHHHHHADARVLVGLTSEG